MRRPFNFRISEAGQQWVQTLADEHSVTQADVFRAVLRVAVANREQVVNRIKEAKEQP